MDKTICGHERDVLIGALQHQAKTGRPLKTTKLCGCGTCTTHRAVDDPAKLAEMLAARGRELGLDFRCYGTTDFLGSGIVGVVPGVSRLNRFTIPQARAILLQWLQLPDVPRDASKGDEFGQCDVCGDGIDPPSDVDDHALSAWESDHPGEQVSLCKFDTRWLCVPCLSDAVRQEAERGLRGAT